MGSLVGPERLPPPANSSIPAKSGIQRGAEGAGRRYDAPLIRHEVHSFSIFWAAGDKPQPYINFWIIHRLPSQKCVFVPMILNKLAPQV